MIDFKTQIRAFFDQVAQNKIEIYNEFSLQFELGIYLRSVIDARYKIEFERPVSFFGLSVPSFVKKEIDLALYTPDQRERYAIELKYPRQKAYPKRMNQFCEDICFAEQLVAAGFNGGLFVAVVDDARFYSGKAPQGTVYRHFRDTVPVHGMYSYRHRRQTWSFEIQGSYAVKWLDVTQTMKYALVEIGNVL